MSKGKKIALWSVLTVVLAGLVLGGVIVSKFGKVLGHHGWSVQSIKDMQQIAISPREGFPGQNRMTILCMGIDDNWTDNTDEVYTKNARTDTLFFLTLDLTTHKATMLSIPRDTYAHIAGHDWKFKINAAYEKGGPQCTLDTVQELTGVRADHFLVLNIDATKRVVDALGGVDVNVEHEMHRHDHWGHFAVDLKPGFQHLNGDQAVGFARYREPDQGKKATPEDSDERRSYRQHILLRAMVGKAKSFANIAQADSLVDVGMSNIHTDLSRTQLFDLAAIFRGIQPDDIRTATLPGEDFRGVDGAWLYRLYPDKMKAYVDWLVRGDETASRRLVPVVVKNGTGVPGLAQHAVEQLKANGYTDVSNGGNAAPAAAQLTSMTKDDAPARTALLDTGVPDPNAPQDIAASLGLAAPVTARRPVKPNKAGWTPDPVVLVTLGQDYADAVRTETPATGAASGELASPDAAPTSAN